jgi:hypothetical protein
VSNATVHIGLTKVVEGLGYAVARENVVYKPTTGTPWLRATFAPNPTAQAALGEDGPNRLTGILMVDVFAPVGVGFGAADVIAEAVMAAFARGDVVTEGAVSVRIERSYRSRGRTETDWYHVPVTVEYRADVAP